MNSTTMTLTIYDVSIMTQGLSFEKSCDERVGIIQFSADACCNEAIFDDLTLGATLNLTMTNGDTILTWRADITALSETEYKKIRVKQITAETLEKRLQNARISGIWENELAENIIGGIDFGAADLSVGPLDCDDRRISEISASYSAIFEVLESVAEQTGLSWKVDEFFQVVMFRPEEHYCPAIEHGEIMDGVKLDYSLDGVINIARCRAWEYEYIEILAEDTCRAYAKLPVRGTDWQLSGEIVFSPLWHPEDFKIDLETLEAFWSPNIYPFYARFFLRRPAVVTLEDESSIALYGPREMAPMSDDGGISVANARIKLAHYLSLFAHPIVAIRFSAIKFGYQPDSFAECNLTRRGIVQDLFISRVRYYYSGVELQCDVEASTRTGFRQDYNATLEMAKRLNKIEKTGLHPKISPGVPVSHPVISPPPGQMAVKPGDIVTVSGDGTPDQVFDGVMIYDIQGTGFDISPHHIEYNRGTGEYSGTFTVPDEGIEELIRLEIVLANKNGESFGEGYKSNPISFDNIPPDIYSITSTITPDFPGTATIALGLSFSEEFELKVESDDLSEDERLGEWIPYPASNILYFTIPEKKPVEITVTARDWAYNISVPYIVQDEWS